MTKTKQIDPAYYENTDFGDDFFEADKRGEVIWTRHGESALEAAIKRRAEEKKKVHVGMRIPSGIVNRIKNKAAAAGIPWTSYACAILEQAVAEPQTNAV